jgi:beta-lactamase class A
MHPRDKLRRRLLLGLALAPAGLLAACSGSGSDSRPARLEAKSVRGVRFLREVAELEARSGGRLGVAVVDTRDGFALGHRAGERFLMCSTFKVLLGAVVLRLVDEGIERLDRVLPVQQADLVSHSPVTEKSVGNSLTIGELCAATITVSDNAAANLLFRAVGGPSALTAFLRGIGDRVTRSDRIETALNLWSDADRDADTTTPSAMASTLAELLGGSTLSEASRAQLRAWLLAASTGAARIRAGLPADVVVGDKTGTGPTSTNDVAWIEGPRGGPYALAVYYADAPGDLASQNAVIAAVARAFSAFDIEPPQFEPYPIHG